MANAWKSAFSGLRSVFSGLFTVLKKVTSIVGDTLVWAWRKLKWVIAGTVATLALSYRAWSKEAEAQEKIGAILRRNMTNYRAAGREVDRISRRVLRTTNFNDDDVRGVFGVMTAMGGRKGFGAARRLMDPILDVAAARGESPEQIAELVARALHRGEIGRLNMIMPVNKRLFARDKVGAIEQALLAQASPDAAERMRAVSPFAAFRNNVGEVMEQLGRVVGTVLNPVLEALATNASDLATKFEDMSAKEVWNTIRDYGIDMWHSVRAAAMATFMELRDWVKGVFNSDQLGPLNMKRGREAVQNVRGKWGAIFDFFKSAFNPNDPNSPMHNIPNRPFIPPSISQSPAFKAYNAMPIALPVSAGSISKSGRMAGPLGAASSAFNLVSSGAMTMSPAGPGAGATQNQSWQDYFQNYYKQFTGREFNQGPVGQSIDAFKNAYRGMTAEDTGMMGDAERAAVLRNPNPYLIAQETVMRGRENDKRRAIDAMLIDRTRGAMATL